MLDRLRTAFDPYILALLGTVALASLLPATGRAAGVVEVAANGGIVLLFFLHGAKLSREAALAGAGHWRLHAAVLFATFALFPLLGLALARIPRVDPLVAGGFLFLTLLPSTVQSSVAFTSIARGNVAAAICAATFSNLGGLVLTPLLTALLMHGHGATVSLGAVERIFAQLLLPFIAGQIARPWIGGVLARHRALVTYVDRGSILLVVYSAFSAAVVAGLWHRLPLTSLGEVLALDAALLAVVLACTWWAGAALGFAREDRIVLLFCGSKKSLATGVPMAGVLFAPAVVGTAILPLMLFHQIQLMACAVIARHLGGVAAMDES